MKKAFARLRKNESRASKGVEEPLRTRQIAAAARGEHIVGRDRGNDKSRGNRMIKLKYFLQAVLAGVLLLESSGAKLA